MARGGGSRRIRRTKPKDDEFSNSVSPSPVPEGSPESSKQVEGEREEGLEAGESIRSGGPLGTPPTGDAEACSRGPEGSVYPRVEKAITKRPLGALRATASADKPREHVKYCKSFLEKGWCPFGEACKFAHVHSLRELEEGDDPRISERRREKRRTATHRPRDLL